MNTPAFTPINENNSDNESAINLLRGKFPAQSQSTKIGIIIFLVLIISYAYFPQNWHNVNAVSRMALTISIIEEGTVKINKYHRVTKDKALYEGDYYSDKAPGTSFTSLPLSIAIINLLRLAVPNFEFISVDGLTGIFALILYSNTLVVSGLSTAFTALVLYWISQRIGASISGAVFAMVGFGLATQAWGWATAFFGHALVSACLFLGFSSIYLCSQSKDDPRKVGIFGFAAGALLGWAIVTEYSAAVASFFIALFGFYKIKNWERADKLRLVTCASAGFIPSIIILLIYNNMAFGSPFSVGYGYVQGFEGMKEGFFGITVPDPEVLLKITFSPYRGLFWFSPLLITSPIGLFFMWHDRNKRAIVLLIVCITAYYLLLNSAYHYWDGGGSTGPRHLTPVIPFLCLPLSMVWTKTSSGYKPILVTIFSISFLIGFVSAAINMYSGTLYNNPLFEFLIPGFLNEGNRNIILIGLKKIIGIQFYEALDPKLMFRLSMVPIILVWAAGYLTVANRIKKFPNEENNTISGDFTRG